LIVKIQVFKYQDVLARGLPSYTRFTVLQQTVFVYHLKNLDSYVTYFDCLNRPL